MKINGQILTNSTKEEIRHVDSKTMFKEYVRKKFKYEAHFMDVAARDSFNSIKATALIIKFAHGYNHYRIREVMINRKSTGTGCSQCNKPET